MVEGGRIGKFDLFVNGDVGSRRYSYFQSVIVMESGDGAPFYKNRDFTALWDYARGLGLDAPGFRQPR